MKTAFLDNNTRTYPRTLSEAFGPYARGPICEKPDPTPLGHRVLEVCMPIVLVAVVGAIALGY